ncbi:hypothetical protein GCK32_021017 [Trichostrongylus colubriformis]|uniref:Uncharacterized protein n=1 Tax=Trichostrongylus colubriformis TaxID=6319 RepID=A0AAN8F5B6_TRICO
MLLAGRYLKKIFIGCCLLDWQINLTYSQYDYSALLLPLSTSDGISKYFFKYL